MVNMIKELKVQVKRSMPYRYYSALRLVKDKYSIGWKDVFHDYKIYGSNCRKLLNSVKICNCGVGEFFYTIDDSIIHVSKNIVIGNIPVDYAYILNHDIRDSRMYSVISSYVGRINDKRVTLNRPHDLREALQSILFWNSLLWQTGHQLVGLGRLDKVLEPYEVPENGRQLICDFLKTLHCKYDYKSSAYKGDTGQIILLGGLESDGSYFTNQYTYLILECLMEINLPDPKVLLRVSKSMPENLLELAVKCIMTGVGSPLLSNDDKVVPCLIDFGYDYEDAYNYGVSACWEPLSIGNSLEQNNMDNIAFGKCAHEMIVSDEFSECENFEQVLALYKKILHRSIDELIIRINRIRWEKDPILSMLMGVEDIAGGDAKYNNYGILSIGLSSAIDSLLNIKRLAFEKKEYDLAKLKSTIVKDHEKSIRSFTLEKSGFGTDDDEAVQLTNYIISDTENYLKSYRNMFGGKVKFGLSSPAYIVSAYEAGATLDGRKAGEPFRTHISKDSNDITGIINFETRLKFTGLSCNANVLDIVIPKNIIEDNINKILKYIQVAISEGIFQMQFNVLSSVQLMDAKEHPENHMNLIVRVWGFSAYFNDLPEEYKDLLIKRALESESAA